MPPAHPERGRCRAGQPRRPQDCRRQEEAPPAAQVVRCSSQGGHTKQLGGGGGGVEGRVLHEQRNAQILLAAACLRLNEDTSASQPRPRTCTHHPHKHDAAQNRFRRWRHVPGAAHSGAQEAQQHDLAGVCQPAQAAGRRWRGGGESRWVGCRRLERQAAWLAARGSGTSGSGASCTCPLLSHVCMQEPGGAVTTRSSPVAQQQPLHAAKACSSRWGRSGGEADGGSPARSSAATDPLTTSCTPCAPIASRAAVTEVSSLSSCGARIAPGRGGITEALNHIQ